MNLSASQRVFSAGPWRPLVRMLLTFVVLLAVAVRPVAAQSILRDAETEALFQDMMDPLLVAAGLQPGQVRVHLLGDRSINAFVAGSQDIYVFSGLIEAADSAEEVQGVLAHELGHVMGGHAIRVNEGAKAATGISLLSLLLGAAAIAAGGGEAGMGIMMAGQQAALGKFLAFSRVQESTADAAGAQYLSKAGISGRGSLAFFKKLQNLEFRYGIKQDDDQAYGRTHPMSGDRIQALREVYVVDPAWDKPADAAIEARFQRIKAKLSGYIADPERTLRKYPESDKSVPSALCARLCLAQERLSAKGAGRSRRPARDRSDRPLFPRARRPGAARIGAAQGGDPGLAQGCRGIAVAAADRRHAGPCADRDRGPGQLSRGRRGAEDRRRAR